MGYKEAESYNMSTVTNQKVKDSKDTIKAIEEVKQLLIALEKKMSFYLKDSEVSKINKNSGILPVRVSNDTIYVVEKSIEYSTLTNGLFDISLAPVIQEWGIFSEHEKIPREKKVRELLNLVDYRNICIDKSNKTILLNKLGAKIDLGGIAKGYATDQAIQIYKKHNIDSAMINLGGNVAVLGKKSDGTPWIVGIQNPEMERGNILCAVSCEDTSVVTSGNYVRNFKARGQVYGHIIDKYTGKPIESCFTSVTVITKLGIRADALSTAIFAMDFVKAIEFIKQTNDVEVILITDSDEIWVSKSLADKFYLLTEEYRVQYF